MADYKDIIAGTLGSIVGKAKELAGSETVVRFRDKVLETAESNGVKGIYDQGANRAKIYARIAKLSLEMNGQHQELSRVYAEIGKLCYEQYRSNPEGFFAPLFSQVEELGQSIRAKQDEIDMLKDKISASAQGESDIDVEIGDFEDIVAATEEDGSSFTDK